MHQESRQNLSVVADGQFIAQVTCVLPMHQPAIGMLTLNSSALTFSSHEGKLDFSHRIAEIAKVKDHNSLHLTLYIKNDKTRHLYFTTLESQILTDKWMLNYKEWLRANKQGSSTLQPWLGFLAGKGVPIIHGHDELKGKKRLYVASRLILIIMLIALILVAFKFVS